MNAAAKRALVAKVHLAKKHLHLDDDTYRDVLRRMTGRDSAGTLSVYELERVVGEMRRLGWAGETSRRSRTTAKPHVRKVWAIWNDIVRLGGVRSEEPRAALRAWCERQAGVTDPEWLTVEQARSVIEALKAWRDRLRPETPRGA